VAQHSVDNVREIFEVVFVYMSDISAEIGVGNKTKISKIDNLDTGLGLSLSKLRMLRTGMLA
jgi:hypothetical protein